MPRFITNDGVTLNYEDEGRGQAVVLINGYCAPATAWALTQDSLLDAGFRVVAFDRRSTGESETPIFGQRMARHGRDIAELLDHLELSEVTMVGASMGGNAIWAYIDQCGAGRLRGVVVVDQTPKMLNSPDWSYGFYGFEANSAGTLFAEGVPPTGVGRAPEKSGPAIARLIDRLGAPPSFRDPAAVETIKLLADHAVQDWRDLVERTARPVLMIAGRESQVWPCEHAAAAVAGNPYGRAVIIEDSGHAVNIDQPDRFNDVLLDFLGSDHVNDDQITQRGARP